MRLLGLHHLTAICTDLGELWHGLGQLPRRLANNRADLVERLEDRLRLLSRIRNGASPNTPSGYQPPTHTSDGLLSVEDGTAAPRPQYA